MNFGPGAFRLCLAAAVVATHLSRLKIGITAVMIFFILSGYWVTRMYCEKYRNGPRPLARFYLSRFLRLWPAFAVALLLTLALRTAVGASTSLRDLLAFPMLGVASHRHDLLGISWSLDIEMQFYLALPLLVAWLAGAFAAPGTALSAPRFSPGEPAAGMQTRLLLLLPLIVAGWWLHRLTGIETLAGYLPAFTAGALIYLCDFSARRRTAIWALIAFGGAGLMLAAFPSTRGIVLTPGMNEVYTRMGGLAWAFVLLPFVAWNLRQPGGRSDRMLGDLSYSLYLTHYPLVEVAKFLAGGDLSLTQKTATLAVIAGVALAFYALVDRTFERRRMLWVDSLVLGKPVAAR